MDSKSGNTVVQLFAKMNKAAGLTIVMFTHDPKMASCCNRVLLLKDEAIIKELKKENDQKAFYLNIIRHMAII